MGHERGQHRDPVLGLRQHGHAVPCLPPAGRAAGRCSRRSTTRPPSTATPASRARCRLHIPWDKVDDWKGLAAYARERGLVIGGINSNTFQDLDYKLGSVCHPDARVRAKAVAAIVECCEIAEAMDAQAVKVWLGDGTNYPGQDDLRGRHRRLVEGLQEAYAALPAGARMYLEYKLYEPALYATDVQDWGQSLNVVRQLGDRAGVCVDTGHHAMGVNIEQIVALLLAEGKLFAFDLNDKKYGDDDLMVGSIDPYQLFRIAHELVNAMRDDADPVAQATANATVLHARPVPQHRAQGPGDDPERHEPPGDDREGAPGRPRAAPRRAGGGRRARGERLPVGRVQHRRPAAARGAARAARPPGGPVPAYLGVRRGARRSTPPGPAAPLPAGAEPMALKDPLPELVRAPRLDRRGRPAHRRRSTPARARRATSRSASAGRSTRAATSR